MLLFGDPEQLNGGGRWGGGGHGRRLGGAGGQRFVGHSDACGRTMEHGWRVLDGGWQVTADSWQAMEGGWRTMVRFGRKPTALAVRLNLTFRHTAPPFPHAQAHARAHAHATLG